ncbi:MAG: hypothetical protein CSA66_02055 [Proteobacteria bacterium]|nr:MAG: hypothetical protein CSA66_02055 [Pseudomonadota bacterium]
MRQAAALESFIAEHGAWAGQVQGLMFNSSSAVAGLDYCATGHGLPILQDDPAGRTWMAFGAIYDGVVIVDQGGALVAWIAPYTAESEAEIEATVEALLAPR